MPTGESDPVGFAALFEPDRQWVQGRVLLTKYSVPTYVLSAERPGTTGEKYPLVPTSTQSKKYFSIPFFHHSKIKISPIRSN